MCLKEVCDNSLVGRRIRVLMLTYLSLVMLSCLVVSYPLNFGKKEKRKKKRKREREREREWYGAWPCYVMRMEESGGADSGAGGGETPWRRWRKRGG